MDHVAHYGDALLSEQQVQKLAAAYRGLVQRHMYWARRHRGALPSTVYLGKNPHVLANTRILLAAFPDARIVHILRDPAERLLSCASLMHSMSGVFSMPEAVRPARAIDKTNTWHPWLEHHALHALQQLEQRQAWAAQLPPMEHPRAPRVAIVVFEDVVLRPHATTRAVYDQLNLPAPKGAFARVLATADAAQQRRTNKHKYTLQEYPGLLDTNSPCR